MEKNTEHTFSLCNNKIAFCLVIISQFPFSFSCYRMFGPVATLFAGTDTAAPNIFEQVGFSLLSSFLELYSPKQEHWIKDYVSTINSPILCSL